MRATGEREQGIGSSGGVNHRPLLAARRRAAGFTIIELMIAAVIALIIFGIGLMIITGASQAHTDARTRIRTNDKARMFFEQFERDLSGAYTGRYHRDALVQATTPLSLIAGTYACMTTTTEDFTAGTGTEYQSIRYYVVNATNNKHLCRETIRNAALPDTLVPSNDDILCRDIESLETSFWLANGSSYTAGTATNATHLLVKLTILDPNQELTGDQRKRFYQVYMPIPDGLAP
jgi:type II secretory pathway component PulJ